MRYRVEVVRSGGWWAIGVPGYPGVYSQARRIDQVPKQAAAALSLALDCEVSPDDIDVEAHPGGELDEAISQARAAREAAELSRERASTAMRQAVAKGLAAGLPLRDIGRLLGVTHQRVAAIARQIAA